MSETSTLARATPLDGALWLVRHGFAVFTADHPGLAQCAGIGRGHDQATCTDRGKHPTVAFTKGHTRDEQQVHRDFGTQLRNVGIYVGACAGPQGEQLLVVDSDRPGAIEDVAAQLGQQHTPTMRVRTAKGYHDYYWAPGDVKLGNRLGQLQGLFDGDVRSGNAFVIGPGSVHATGVAYELEDEEQPPVALPEWLLTALLTRPVPAQAPEGTPTIVIPADRHDAYTRRAVQAECDAITRAPDGDQNNTINRAAFSVGTLVGAGALTEGDARQTLLSAARAGNHPEGRALAAISSGLTAGIAHPRTPWPPVARASSWPTAVNLVDLIAPDDTATASAAPAVEWEAPQEPVVELPTPMPAREWDDIGNAQRVVDRFGTEVRWIKDTEQWATYETGRWTFKGANTAVWTRVVATINALPEEADNYSDEQPVFEPGEKPTKEDQLSERERFEKFARQQRMRPKLAAAREVLQAHPGLHVHMDHFDRPEMLLNVGNGIVDLTTGELRTHERGLYLMQQSPVAYRPGAPAPMWEDFLHSVMPDDERRAYLARVVGYTLTGSTQEQAMFIHHGGGQNGKGVFMRILMSLLGEYAQSVPRSTLLAKQGEGIPNDVARMMGKRLLATTETSAGKKLDDELVKQLTGEDTMSARFMRAEFFDFRPVGKIHLATNYLPSVGSGHGMARRLQDIGWDVTVPPSKRVAKLDEKIMATEAAGVLNWAIAGCLEWQHRGLDVPASVQEKTREHIANSDPLAMWLDEETEEAEGHVIETRSLYANYKVWSETANLRPMSMTAFSLALGERDIESGKDSRTRRAVTFGRKLITFDFTPVA